jgi:hypothetical protein
MSVAEGHGMASNQRRLLVEILFTSEVVVRVPCGVDETRLRYW